MRHIPGQRTRQAIAASAFPELRAWVGASIRAAVAGAFYLLGYHHVAFVLAVMAGVMLVGAIENAVGGALADGIKRLHASTDRSDIRRYQGWRGRFVYAKGFVAWFFYTIMEAARMPEWTFAWLAMTASDFAYWGDVQATHEAREYYKEKGSPS